MTLRFKILIVVAFTGMAMQIACAQNSSKTGYSRGEIRKMMREAHPADQYRAIADHFRDRQDAFELSAQKEHAEWKQEARGMTFMMVPKYPRPVDASRNWYRYLTARAVEMGQKASYYEGLASIADKSGQ
jgi:hypothetical protein